MELSRDEKRGILGVRVQHYHEAIDRLVTAATLGEFSGTKKAYVHAKNVGKELKAALVEFVGEGPFKPKP